MRGYITRLVVINALICAVFGALFTIPIGRLEVGLIGGLLFGVTSGLFIELTFRRWKDRWLYHRRLLFLVLLEVLLTLYLLLPAYIVYFNLRPARLPITEMPPELINIAQEVALSTSDGITLSGWYIPPQNGAVIIALHGLGSNRLGVLPHTLMLAEQGYGVLMMDMRAHGASGGEVFADGWNSAVDVRAMVDYLQSHPEVEHIGALGLSAGAISILHAGAAIEAIEAFVADGTGVAAIEDLLDPLFHIPLLPGSWCRITGWVFALQGYSVGCSPCHRCGNRSGALRHAQFCLSRERSRCGNRNWLRSMLSVQGLRRMYGLSLMRDM
ncbi:MAG: alpha/beta hydrolase [Anaerolineales bacterium]|nr:alpha/beta hydrolase [Anaerolineales bacterium]